MLLSASRVLACSRSLLALLSGRRPRSAQDFSNCSVAQGPALRAARRRPHALLRLARHSGADRLQRHPALRRRSRDLQRHEPGRARGNVMFVSGTSRISAERMEFNTKTKTGIFYIASGIATSRAGRSTTACSARRSRTRTSAARRSKSSDRRNIAWSAAASRPACSRRRAGTWSRARSR